MSNTRGLQISSRGTGPALTPEQKRFNTLIRQIEQTRQTLTAWQDNIPLFRQTHVQVLLPLQSSLMAAGREWAFALDALLDQPGWSRAERATLRELVCDAASELLDVNDDDAALKTLFDKHSDIDFDTDKQQDLRIMKELTEVFTGLDLGDSVDIHTDDDLFQRMSERMAEHATAGEARRSARAQRRRKTAAQQQREVEAQLATQSVREIYRKLASALHPDRERDPVRREAKTALMQKVNQAYAANDLLTLLETQLQIEQVDVSHIASAGTQRLKHYNSVLAEQLASLKAEIERVETGFRIDFGLDPDSALDPRKLGALIARQLRLLRSELTRQQLDQRMLADKVATQRWLKQQREVMRDARLYNGYF